MDQGEQVRVTVPARASLIARLLRESYQARAIASILSGVGIGLAFPDTSFQSAAFLAPGLLIAVAAVAPRARSAFFSGWIALTVAWLINVPWVIIVMSDQGGIPLAGGIAIFVAMAAYLGAYGGLFALIVYRLAPGRAWWPWLLIALGWAVVEYGRTILLTGFPWNLIAATIIDLPYVQLSPYIGPYALGALILIPSVVLARMLVAETDNTRRVLAIAGTAVFLIGWGVIGIVATDRGEAAAGETRTVALLQPNIEQGVRWDATQAINLLFLMQEMTEEAQRSGAEVIIWPESTVPLRFAETMVYRHWIEEFTRAHDVDIILGSVATDPRDQNRIWNSAFLVSEGEIRGRYDKMRLVPFGEYVPLRRALFFAEKLVRTVGTFEFGESDEPLRGKESYGVGICYEIVYPQIGAQQIRNGAEILVTITNDAWYGESSAARQHLDSARLRAVEGRRWLVRAATTGISAAVDPNGRIIEQIPMNRKGIIMTEVPVRTGLTPYVRWGDWFPLVAALILIAAIWVRRKEREEDGRRADSAD